MEELRLSAKDKQDARIALLRYYSSECVTHGAYLLALTITFLGFVEFTPHILELLTTIVFPTLSEELVRDIILSLMASGFIVLTIHTLGQIIVWSYLKSAILNVRPKEGSRVKYDPERSTLTFLQQLHEACMDYVKKKHRISGQIYGLKAWHLTLIWLDLSIIFIILCLLTLYI